MILVTGGTGLVGSHLLYHLSKKGEKIRAIYRTESSLEKVKTVFSYYSENSEIFNAIEWVKADITDVPSMIPVFENISIVYHCAAFISFDPKDYLEMRKVNIHGSAIIANLCIDTKVKKLCFVSSIAAVGDPVEGTIADESCDFNKLADNSGYAITKFGGEMEIWRASQEGVSVVIVNPGVILGGGFWNSGSGKLFAQVYNGFKYFTEGVTGFVSVKDVVSAMILLTDSEIENERFILVSDNLSFKMVLSQIADALGKTRPSIRIKSWQTALVWRLAFVLSKITGKAPMLSKYSARSSHSISKYSSEKIKSEIGFEFEPIKNCIEEVGQQFLKDLNG